MNTVTGKKICASVANYFRDFSALFAKKFCSRGKNIHNLLSNVGIFIVFVTTVSNERIWYRYSNGKRTLKIPPLMSYFKGR